MFLKVNKKKKVKVTRDTPPLFLFCSSSIAHTRTSRLYFFFKFFGRKIIIIIKKIIAMGKVFLFGGMGAIVNCAIALRASSVASLEHFVTEILVQPFVALRTLTPAFLGFMCGTAIVLAWTFIRALTVRFLLGYNGWFLNPKGHSIVNKVSMIIVL